jgi:hypothetical protein
MKWVYRFFVVLGVIFFVLLLRIAYFFVADPLNIRPLLATLKENNESIVVPDESEVPTTTGTLPTVTTAGTVPETPKPMLSTEQTQALEQVGINPQSVPVRFTPEQITCFVGVLGQDRVDAIVAGDTPTPTEFFTAKNCL